MTIHCQALQLQAAQCHRKKQSTNKPMARSSQYEQGRRNGVKWAVTWLHERAELMNDCHQPSLETIGVEGSF